MRAAEECVVSKPHGFNTLKSQFQSWPSLRRKSSHLGATSGTIWL